MRRKAAEEQQVYLADKERTAAELENLRLAAEKKLRDRLVVPCFIRYSDSYLSHSEAFLTEQRQLELQRLFFPDTFTNAVSNEFTLFLLIYHYSNRQRESLDSRLEAVSWLSYFMFKLCQGTH